MKPPVLEHLQGSGSLVTAQRFSEAAGSQQEKWARNIRKGWDYQKHPERWLVQQLALAFSINERLYGRRKPTEVMCVILYVFCTDLSFLRFRKFSWLKWVWFLALCCWIWSHPRNKEKDCVSALIGILPFHMLLFTHSLKVYLLTFRVNTLESRSETQLKKHSQF